MAIATAYWAADLDGMISDLSATFYAGALTWSCSITDLDQSQTLLLTGVDGKDAISAIFPYLAASAAATYLVANGRVSILRPGHTNPRNYAVVTVEKSPDNVSYTLICKEDSRA